MRGRPARRPRSRAPRGAARSRRPATSACSCSRCAAGAGSACACARAACACTARAGRRGRSWRPATSTARGRASRRRCRRRACAAPGTWQLGLYVRAHGLRRRYLRFASTTSTAAELPAPPGLAARAVAVPVRPHRGPRARPLGARGRPRGSSTGDVLELTGGMRLAAAERLEAAPRGRRLGDGGAARPATARSSRGCPLRSSTSRRATSRTTRSLWQLAALDGGRRVPLALPGPSPALRWCVLGPRARARAHAGRRQRDRRSRRAARCIVGARWRGDAVELDVRLPPGPRRARARAAGLAPPARARLRARARRRTRACCARSCPSPSCCWSPPASPRAAASGASTGGRSARPSAPRWPACGIDGRGRGGAPARRHGRRAAVHARPRARRQPAAQRAGALRSARDEPVPHAGRHPPAPPQRNPPDEPQHGQREPAAVRRAVRRSGRAPRRGDRGLCDRLGLGVEVDVGGAHGVEPLADPAAASASIASSASCETSSHTSSACARSGPGRRWSPHSGCERLSERSTNACTSRIAAAGASRTSAEVEHLGRRARRSAVQSSSRSS